MSALMRHLPKRRIWPKPVVVVLLAPSSIVAFALQPAQGHQEPQVTLDGLDAAPQQLGELAAGLVDPFGPPHDLASSQAQTAADLVVNGSTAGANLGGEGAVRTGGGHGFWGMALTRRTLSRRFRSAPTAVGSTGFRNPLVGARGFLIGVSSWNGAPPGGTWQVFGGMETT